MPENKKVRVELLDFDLINPRLIKTADSQSEAIKGILESEAKSCIELLNHIVNNGLSPVDQMIVIEGENSRYTVLEGNRRLIALKLLNRDAAVQDQLDPEHRKKVQKIINKAKPLHDVNVSVFKDREQAKPWISLKHSKSSNGATTQSWKPFEKDRYEYTNDHKRCTPTLALFYFAQLLGEQNRTLATDVKRIHDDHYSTLQRVVESANFQQITGIRIDGTAINGDRGENYLKSMVTELFQDIGASEANSRSLNTKDAIKDFLTGLKNKNAKIPLEKPVKFNIDIPHTLNDVTAPSDDLSNKKGNVTKTAKTTKKTPSTRAASKKALAGLVPSQIENLGEPERSILNETQRLHLSKSPHLVAAAYRILLDLSTARFEREVTDFSFTGSPDLDGKVCEIINYLDPQANDPKGRVQLWSTLKSYRQQTGDKPLKPLQLGVHGTNATVLVSTVESIDPVVKAVLVSISNKLGEKNHS